MLTMPSRPQEVNSSYASYLNSVKDGVGSIASTAVSAPGKAAEYVPHEVGAGGVKIRLKNPPEESEGGGEKEESKEE